MLLQMSALRILQMSSNMVLQMSDIMVLQMSNRKLLKGSEDVRCYCLADVKHQGSSDVKRLTLFLKQMQRLCHIYTSLLGLCFNAFISTLIPHILLHFF